MSAQPPPPGGPPGWGPPPAGPFGYGPPPKQGMSTGVKVILGVFIGFFVVLILGVGGCVACGALLVGSAEEEDDGRNFGTVDVGEPIKVRETEYTVIDVRTADGVTDEVSGQAEGTFVLVDVRLRYQGNEPEFMFGSDLQLWTRSGEQFDVDEDALLEVDDPLFEYFGESDVDDLEQVVQPRQTLEGTVIYDVPDADVRGSRLRVKALLGNGHGYINLGL